MEIFKRYKLKMMLNDWTWFCVQVDFMEKQRLRNLQTFVGAHYEMLGVPVVENGYQQLKKQAVL